MIELNTHPDRYRHWRLSLPQEGEDAAVARLELLVQPDQTFAEGYELKLNSYDLGVDLELADAVQRIRFEHPRVKVVVITSAHDRAFCAGANIGMLAGSSHPFKVNFCKFTNETRLSIEDASRHSGVRFLAAVNGACAGGGYELALACDEIYLVDDSSSTVSLPEVPLLGVLPGTGGLTRLVDKRKVRRDLADVFCTLAEGVRGRRAKAWGLVDDTFPRSRFAERVAERARTLAGELPDRGAARGIVLGPVEREVGEDRYEYRYVSLVLEPARRTATLTVRAPDDSQPRTDQELFEAGDGAWVLRAFRELDDAICQLRFCHEEIGLVELRTEGDVDAVLAAERALASMESWLAREVVLHMARVLRRYELTARSLFALADRGSCFAGPLFELALASDRIYALDDPDDPVELAIGPLSDGRLPMVHGLSRLQARFLAEPQHAARLAAEQPRVAAADADELGLVTVLADDIDWEDEVRIACQERVSLSPDALTGMEASLRLPGPENADAKIFGRLSAWQNWIFTRPNATGEAGALVCYGRPEQPCFDWRRT